MTATSGEVNSTLLVGAIYYLMTATKAFETKPTYRIHVPAGRRNDPGPHHLDIVTPPYRELLGMTRNSSSGLKFLSVKRTVTVNGPLTHENLMKAFDLPTSPLYNTVANGLGGLKLGFWWGMDHHPMWMRVGVPLAIHVAQKTLNLPMTSSAQHAHEVELVDQEIPSCWPYEARNVIMSDLRRGQTEKEFRGQCDTLASEVRQKLQ